MRGTCATRAFTKFRQPWTQGSPKRDGRLWVFSPQATISLRLEQRSGPPLWGLEIGFAIAMSQPDRARWWWLFAERMGQKNGETTLISSCSATQTQAFQASLT